MRAHNAPIAYWILIGFVIALGLPIGCQEDHPARPEPIGDYRVARVEVDRAVLGPQDSTEVRAWIVRGSATPAVGAPVVFGELLGQETGVFSKNETLTDAGGWARAVYRPAGERTGLVTLRVRCGESVQYTLLEISTSGSSGLDFTFGTPAGATSLPADGVSTLEVTITVRQSENGAAVASLPIALSVGDHFEDMDGDGVFSEGDRVPANGDRDQDGTWDAEGTWPESVITDNQGLARFTYRAGSTVGPVFVRASTLGAFRELQLLQHSQDLQTSVIAEARELLADGVSATSILAQVLDWAGQPVPGVLVKFVAGEPFTDTDEDGFYTAGEVFEDRNANERWDAMGTITSVVSTSAAGLALARYQSGIATGRVTVRATTTSGAAETTLDLIEVPPAQTLLLRLARPSLYADGRSPLTGEVEVRDLNGNPLSGKILTLSAGERYADVNGDGLFTPGSDAVLDDVDENGGWTAIGSIPAEVVTGGNGVASFTYTAGLIPAEVWIRAAVDGASSEVSLDLEALPPIASVRVATAFDRIVVQGGGGLDRTTVTATCLDPRGFAVPAGVPVSFRIVSGPGGEEQIEGEDSQGSYLTTTDESGQASAVLRAGTVPGLVQVGVSAGSVMSTTGIFVGAGLAASLSCRADSVSLRQNHSTLVFAYVYDEAHNAVDDGTVVLFHADEGMIYTGEGGDRSTTRNGVATATFVAVASAGTGDGTAEVTAETNGGVNGAIRCTTNILMPPPPGAIDRIGLNPTIPEIAVQGTGGAEQTRIRAQGFDARNTPVGANRSITFRITEGPGGGEYLNDGVVEAQALTDAAGLAEVVLASGTVSGTVVVAAWATGDPDVTAHTPVGIAAGPPVYLSVGVDSCNVYGWRRVDVENQVVALVYDLHHNPVRDGTAVHFTANFGMIVGEDGLGNSFTLEGHANAIWYSAADAGPVVITASTHGGTLTGRTGFISSGDPYYVNIISPAEELVPLDAHSGSTLTFLVEVLDVNQLFVLPEAGEVEANYGIVSILPTTNGCTSSIARGTYMANRLDRDDSYTVPDDGIGAIDVVHVGYGHVAGDDEFRVELHTGTASRLNSTLELGSVPAGLQSYFTITVLDQSRNPLGGHTLSVTATRGTIAGSVTTDAFGVASGLFQAPVEPGSVLVEARDLDPNFGGDMILRATVNISAP